jgi:hypothetical protein
MKKFAGLLLLLLVLPSFLLSQQMKIRELPARALTTKELTEQSDVIAVGKVKTLNSEWNANRTRITTRVRIDVREFLKGGGADHALVVMTPGGEIGDVGEIYSGTARFRRDEEVVVFARKKSGGDHEVTGGGEGKVLVHEEKTTGMKTVLKNVPLDDFRSQVMSAAQAMMPGEKKP